MAELIQKTDTLNEGREKLNEAIKDAGKAKIDSSEAKATAEQALDNSESTQTQLDQVVIDGDSSVEAAQARVDEKGQSHTTLKDRIDDGFTKVNSQLAEKADYYQISVLDNKKADKLYVDEKLDNLDGLQIKGYFDTLQGLKTAYPNGTSGLYTVGDALYGWNGSEWRKVIDLEVMPWSDFITTDGADWSVE